jgi:hypothetical protein
MALSPYNRKVQDRILYFHPMSSFREFYVKTSVICNETGWNDVKDAFKVMGRAGGSSDMRRPRGWTGTGLCFLIW